MTEQNKPSWETNPRCEPDQLAMLLRCSKAEDMTEWNEWREANRTEEIWLQGADLRLWHLKGARLSFAHLEGAQLFDAHLEGAKLSEAHLEGAKLWYAHLEGANLLAAHLEEANFALTDLRKADLSDAVVDGRTLFTSCKTDRRTCTTNVALSLCRIDAGLKQLWEYNDRRRNWGKWYARGPWRTWPFRQLVRPFWWTSDYGRSTVRILLLFLAFATAFALVYCTWGIASPPGIVYRLFENEKEAFLVDHDLVMVRSFYFSVVTMTTLGFGDMHAFTGRYWGHVLLTCQVLLGYFFLGALVTRLAIVFQAGGPSASFARAPWRRSFDRRDIIFVMPWVWMRAIQRWRILSWVMLDVPTVFINKLWRSRIRRWVIAGVIGAIIALALHQWYKRAVANWPSAEQYKAAKRELMSQSASGTSLLPEN